MLLDDLPIETRRAIRAALDAGLGGLQAPEPLRLSQWSAKHFHLSADSSQQSGRWTPWPFQVGILDAMGNDDIVELNVRKAKRVGYTKCLAASIAYDAAHRRRNQALWQPTDADRDSFVETEIKPMLDDVDILRRARRSTAGKERIGLKKFRGCLAHFLGGKAQRAYRRITVASAKADEIDAFDAQIEGSLDPITGMRGRTEGAAFPKLTIGTTPRIKGLSHIETREQAADSIVRYHIACKHCSVEHPLTWGGRDLAYGLKWDGDDPETARHICPHCREAITQADYLPDGITPVGGTWVCAITGHRYDDATGEWLDTAGLPTRAPRHLAMVDVWTAYSPQRSWPDIVREFLEAERREKQGDDGPMQGFVNETLGRCWEPGHQITPAEELEARAIAEGLPPRIVPDAALVLTAFADTQDDRLEVVVEAWGPGLERWTIDHRVLFGSPARRPDEQGSVWQQLDDVIRTPYAHESGQLLRISGYGIDSGGHHTQDVYNYGSARAHLTCVVTRGATTMRKPVIAQRPTLQDVDWQGKRVEAGVKLWSIGTDTAKDNIFSRIRFTHGPGALHWHREMPLDFFQQLVVEKPVVKYHKGRAVREYVKPNGARNEALDCAVGNLAMAYYFSLHTWSALDWQRIRDNLVPRHATADLFAASDVAAMPARTPAPAPAHLQQPATTPAPAPTPLPIAPPLPVHHSMLPRPAGRRILSRGIAR